MRFKRSFAVVGAAAAALLLTGGSTMRRAADVIWMDHYFISLAVDYSEGQVYGYSGANEKGGGHALALRYCREYGGTDCRMVVRDAGCLAKANGEGGWGAWGRSDLRGAVEGALLECRKHAKPDTCRINLRVCSQYDD